MHGFENTKSLLKIYSIIIFVTGVIGLIGSLILHNSISSFKFKSYFPYSDSKLLKITCDEKNNFCKNILIPEKALLLDKCSKQHFRIKVRMNDEEYPRGFEAYIETLVKNNIENLINQKITIEPFVFREINKSCIKNSEIYKLYKIFPYPFEKIYQFKQNINYLSSTGSNTINPFFYGETSISNIAKRYPVDYFFKTLMFVLSICLFLYWRKFNMILNLIENNKRRELFYFFGLISALSLFFHILFLGVIFETQLLNKIKSLFIVLFIFFELLAQIILTFKLYKIKKKIFSFFNLNILKLKIYFVTIVGVVSVFAIYIIRNIETNFENIFEWNFFIFLLFFYFLTFIMVKKNQISIHPPPKTL
tara:strand:+ start:405 stop:1493 length:1089 start_codon:yes stop_codon:yes gene_type:complete